jgi:hypothetical protein
VGEVRLAVLVPLVTVMLVSMAQLVVSRLSLVCRK